MSKSRVSFTCRHSNSLNLLFSVWTSSTNSSFFFVLIPVFLLRYFCFFCSFSWSFSNLSFTSLKKTKMSELNEEALNMLCALIPTNLATSDFFTSYTLLGVLQSATLPNALMLLSLSLLNFKIAFHSLWVVCSSFSLTHPCFSTSSISSISPVTNLL